jgi:hypothetical protein
MVVLTADAILGERGGTSDNAVTARFGLPGRCS